MTRNFRLKAETDGKGRILYGNETNMNEYPWQVSQSSSKNNRSIKYYFNFVQNIFLQDINVDWKEPLLRWHPYR